MLWDYNAVKGGWTVNGATHSSDEGERQKNKLAQGALRVLLGKFYWLPDTGDPREKK